MSRDIHLSLKQTLFDLGYEYLNIESEDDLKSNLRKQLEDLNSDSSLKFSDSEWEWFFQSCICKEGEDFRDKLQKIQGNQFCQRLVKDDDERCNVLLVDRSSINRNKLQFIDRYTIENLDSTEDQIETALTILMNGFPIMHIMLFPPGSDLKQEFNNLSEVWKWESFGAKWNFFDFIEIFVISNGKNTKYFSCTTYQKALEERIKRRETFSTAVTSSSFWFTSYWSTIDNAILLDLASFSKIFLEQKNVRELILYFSILANRTEKEKMNLKVMRPYQVYATKKIINRIENSSSSNLLGTKMAGGYIWHATGSGKTLTSFKVCKLASKMPWIDKAIFVADRKDIDIQTYKEYVTFEADATHGTKNTRELDKWFLDSEKKIITTTIQKLHSYAKSVEKSRSKEEQQEIFSKHIVIIFDECHRTQFGKMHELIRKKFVNSHIFGFTGTPILSRVEEDESLQEHKKERNLQEQENRAKDLMSGYKSLDDEDYISTGQRFGERLHQYTLFNAINDENVLKFKVEYVKFLDSDHNLSEEEICRCSARIEQIVCYILENFDNKTSRRKEAISVANKRRGAHNSILTVSSIKLAQKYYLEFKKQLESVPEQNRLTIAIIYTSQEEKTAKKEKDILSENPAEIDASEMSESNKKFLSEIALKDYSARFKTEYTLSRFYEYYKNVSKNTKDGEIDILIVVDMFCTGFDAPGLNTLWVDKKLNKHGLIQAFSRTNRIYRENKEFGNIVCFRTSEKDVDEAIQKYAGSGNNTDLIIAPSFEELYIGGTIDSKTGEVRRGYVDLVNYLQSFLNEQGEFEVPVDKEESFVKSGLDFLKRKNLLRTYDEFRGKEIVDDEFIQKLQAKCISLCEKSARRGRGGLRKHNLESYQGETLSFIKQVETTLEYIISLIVQHDWEKIKTEEEKNKWQSDLNRMIDSAINLRNKRNIFNDFIDYYWSHWKLKEECDNLYGFISKRLEEDLNKIIYSENLKNRETKMLIARSFRNKKFENKKAGLELIFTDFSRIDSHESLLKWRRVINKLEMFYDKYNEFENFIGSTKKWLDIW